MYRLHPSWVAVRGLVAAGRIGPLTAVQSWFWYYNDDPTNIRNIADAGGGALYDIGCYCVNLSRMLFGAEPTPGPGGDRPRSGNGDRHPDQRHPRVRRRHRRRSPARRVPRTTSASTSTARRAGSRSRSRSTSRPIARPRSRRRRRRPAGGARREMLTFAAADPYTVEAERSRAPSSTAGRRRSRQRTRSPTCASSSRSCGGRAARRAAEPVADAAPAPLRRAIRRRLVRRRRRVARRHRRRGRGASSALVAASPRRARPHRGSWRRRRRPASITATTASSSSSWAAAWRRSTATTTAGRAVPRRRRRAGRAVPQRAARSAEPLRFDAPADAATDLDRRDRRVPARRRRRRHRSTSSSCASARTCCCAAWATAASSAPTRRWGFDGGDALDHRVQRHLGGGDAVLPTLAFGNYLVLDEPATPTSTAPTTSSSGPTPTASDYAPPIRSRPGWCTLSMLFSDWDRSGRRDLRVSNDRHYYRDGRGAAVADRARRSRRACTPREDGWQPLRIWGMGIASQDLTGDGYPEVYLTSQADNKLQTLADGAGAAGLRGHRARARRDRAPAVRGRHDAAIDGMAR